MAEQNQENQAEKGTFLILHTDKGDVFLEATESEAAGTYFKGGPVRAFISTNKAGELTGAINLSIGVRGEDGNYQNSDAGVLFRKDGDKGAFLSGYIGGVNVVPGTQEGRTFVNVTPVVHGEDGKAVGTLSVSADIRGPKAEAILSAMPVIARKSNPEPEVADNAPNAGKKAGPKP